jgi:hypothetical protein
MADTSDLNFLAKHGEGPVVLNSPLVKPENANLKDAFAAGAWYMF